MAIVFNLHRFGADEFAVGHLINGDLPEDDEERWSILDAPRYRIKKLLDAHLRAQATLRACRDSGGPFVLFLRSFSTEHKTYREGRAVASSVTADSYRFQEWLQARLVSVGVPLVKLHGGSDAIMPEVGGEGNELSTHSENWEAVAAELIRAAGAIVVLISDLSPGVMRELELIRDSGRMQRCLVAVADPQDTPGRGSGSPETLSASLGDFSDVFVLRTGIYPEAIGHALLRLVSAATTADPLDCALNASFSYLEPDFVDSEDFVVTEGRIWHEMRQLRVMFEDTYWAALKAHGVGFEHFSFPGPWLAAHQLYGLGVATADFNAIREALSYLSILYVFRLADFALLIGPLAKDYEELQAHMFPSGPPDTESRFTETRDPLDLPRRVAVAVRLYEIADEASRTHDPSSANYFFQAALVCALRADDGEDSHRTWIAGNIARDWAQFQAASDQPDWALANYRLALALHRSLAGAHPGRYERDVTITLNNLGALHFRQADYRAADACFAEALGMRRRRPPEAENYLVDLYTSLLNLGLVRVETGDYQAARSLYMESLDVCQQRLATEPLAIADLTRQEGLLALCLSKLPAAQDEAREYAALAAGHLPEVTELSPEAAAALGPLLDEVARVTGGSEDQKREPHQGEPN